jgi:hypothetical protein
MKTTNAATAKPAIRFYGTLGAIEGWRDLLAKDGYNPGEIGTQTSEYGITRHTFDCNLSFRERTIIQCAHWYEIETGQDLRWNCRITFEEL